MTQTITRQDLKAILDAGEPITLIEALPSRYYQAGHLPGAINIPHDEIRERAASVLSNKEQAIVVYCANTACQNSSIAANTLSALGYRNVREYVEGKQDWAEAGLSLEGAAS
jgi:rhodanese-related sulfurtransferase